MSKIANTVTTFDVKGIREELTDVIYNIDPSDTVFTSSVSRGSCKTTFKEWQQDSLHAANTANVHPQGDDVTTFAAITPTVRLGNYTQISRKELIVSDTEEVVDKAGRKSEIGYQLAKLGKEIRIDMESMFLNNIAAAPGDTSTAAVTASMLAYIKTNVVKGAAGVNPVYTNIPNVARTDGTAVAFTEAMLKTVISECWTAGAKPKVVLVGAGNKVVASGFAGIATQYRQNSGTSQATILGAADIYVSDFGTVSIVPSRFQRNRDAFVLDFSLISVDYLRPFKQVPLAKTGDAEKRMLLAEYMLVVKAEKGQGLVADLL
jgi:uncharacterized protein DUF5309